LIDIKYVNVLNAVKQIKVPFLILHGTEDNVVGIEESRRAFEVAIKPKKLIEIKGANHTFSNSNSKYNRKMVSWAVFWPRRPLKPTLIFLFFFFGTLCLLSQFQRKPLPLKYDHSWMVFTLFSRFGLQYIKSQPLGTFRPNPRQLPKLLDQPV